MVKFMEPRNNKVAKHNFNIEKETTDLKNQEDPKGALSKKILCKTF